MKTIKDKSDAEKKADVVKRDPFVFPRISVASVLLPPQPPSLPDGSPWLRHPSSFTSLPLVPFIFHSEAASSHIAKDSGLAVRVGVP